MDQLLRVVRGLFAISYIFAVVTAGLYFPEKATADSIVYGAAATASTNSGTSLVINKPAGVISGDVLIAVIGVQGANPTITSSGWTSSGVKSIQGATNVAVESFYLRAGGSEPSTYTFNISTSATRITGGIVAYRGVVATGNPIEATSTSSSGTDGTLETNAITTTTSSSRIIGVYAMDNAAPRTFTPPTTSGVNERVDIATSNGVNNDVSIEVTDYAQPAAGAFTPAASTASGTGNWAAHQISIKPDGVNHMMLFWDGTGAAPAGWSYVTEANGRFIRGDVETSYGAIGGAATHTPTATVSAATASGSRGNGDVNAANNSATYTHTHASTVTPDPASNLVANRTIKLIRYDAGIPNTIPAGAMAIFDGSPGIPATGWTRMTAFDSKNLVVDNTIVSTDGGSDTHTHNLNWNDMSAAVGQQRRLALVFNIQTSTVGHTHTGMTDTTTSTNATSALDCEVIPVDNQCLPPYVQILLAKADADTAVLSIGLTALFDGAPGGGWVVRSESGGPYHQRFIRGGATYSEGLGSSTHDHVNATKTSTINNGGSPGNAESLVSSGSIAENNHTHLLTADFTAVDHTPPYYNIVVAEKVNFIFNHYAWYDDNDALAVTSRYSSLDIAQDSHIITIPAGNNPPDVNKELRLRIQILVNNSNLASDEIQFRLQFKVDTSTSLTSTTCTSGSWTDVGNNGDSTIWAYAASTPSDGASLTGSSVFSPASTSLHRYVKSSTAGKNITGVNSGETMEWDYHIINNGAASANQYRFRLVEDSGILLSQYGYGSPTVTPVCPTLSTKAQPADQLRHGNLFENTGQEKGFSWAD